MPHLTCSQCNYRGPDPEFSPYSPGLCHRCCPFPLPPQPEPTPIGNTHKSIGSSWGHSLARTGNRMAKIARAIAIHRRE